MATDAHVNSETPDLKVFYTNCDCLTQIKLSELQCFIRTNSPDVIALTESLPKNPLFESSANSHIIKRLYNVQFKHDER